MQVHFRANAEPAGLMPVLCVRTQERGGLAGKILDPKSGVALRG